MKTKNRTVLSEFGLLAVAFVWGGGFVVVKDSLDYISPLWLVAARFVLAALTITFVFFGKIKKLNRGSLLAGSLSGVFIFLGFAVQTIAVQYTTASKNALLTSSYVVLVPFVFWLMIKKRPGLMQIVAAFLCFAGITMLVYNREFGAVNIGDLLTLLCGLMFAIQISLLGIFSKKYDTYVLAIVQMVSCAVIAVAAAVIFEPFPRNLGLRTFGSILYLGLLSTCFAYFVQTVAQKYTPPAHASLILSLECLIGCILSVIIFKDVFTPLMWVGTAVTFASVILSQRNSRNGINRSVRSE